MIAPPSRDRLSAVGATAGSSLRRAAAEARDPLVAIAVLYLVARVVAFRDVDPRSFPDTAIYEQVAAAPLLSEGFLAGGRPPTVPLAYKLLGGDETRAVGQLLLSIGCWIGLAAATAASLRGPALRVVGFAAILAFSLSNEIQLWDADLISESIAISLTAALVGAWLWMIRRPTGWSFAVMLALAAAWTLSRDPHAYLLIMVAATLAGSLLLGRSGASSGAIAAAGLVVVAAGSLVSASVGYPRWLYPVQNLVALRISEDSEALKYFADAGMPVTPRLLQLSRRQRETGVRPFEHPGELYEHPEDTTGFMPFQLWLADHGRRTYTTYLLTHPGAVAAGVEPSTRALLNPDLGHYAADRGPGGAPLVSSLAYAGGAWLMLAWLAIAGALAGTVAMRWGARREWAVPLFLIAASGPFALFVYHAGAQELDRHALIPSILLRLGVLLLVLMAVDQLLRGRRAARTQGAEPEAAVPDRGAVTERPAARSR